MIPYPELFGGLDPTVAKKFRKVVRARLDALRERGYEVGVSNDLLELEEFRIEQPEFSTVSTAFDLQFHPGREAMAQGLFLLKDGERVGTVWRRIVPLRDQYTRDPLTLKECFEGLYIFYDNPLDAPRREKCTLDSELASSWVDTGLICYCGAAWLPVDLQRTGVFKLLVDLALVLCVTAIEQWDWFVACVWEEDREMAIAAFPYMNFTRNMTYCGKPVWLCTTAYPEALKMVLRAADE